MHGNWQKNRYEGDAQDDKGRLLGARTTLNRMPQKSQPRGKIRGSHGNASQDKPRPKGREKKNVHRYGLKRAPILSVKGRMKLDMKAGGDYISSLGIEKDFGLHCKCRESPWIV